MVLPPIPPALKSISPYLQRADELRTKEPIIAYWCTYYAAQVGIALKAKDTASRNFLFDLLGTLEMVKKEIGPTDAIDVEAVSAAFVENFALRVFSMTDNEDRTGAGNRATAKKFLAAANFLEVLKTFPKTEVSESNEEKIRYSKWKAADIAKAYREGRKPTPGPAGSD
ncbi:Vta1 like-domain-containing protein, partial [Mycena sp. CBHHK59/15]